MSMWFCRDRRDQWYQYSHGACYVRIYFLPFCLYPSIAFSLMIQTEICVRPSCLEITVLGCRLQPHKTARRSYLTLAFDYRFGNAVGSDSIPIKFHRKHTASLRHVTNLGCITEHFRK